jgi:hypothetical protein
VPIQHAPNENRPGFAKLMTTGTRSSFRSPPAALLCNHASNGSDGDSAGPG